MHLIREDLTAVYALFGSTEHVPVMGVTRELRRRELNPLVFFCLSSTRPPLVPYFMRAPPFQVGLGLCVLR